MCSFGRLVTHRSFIQLWGLWVSVLSVGKGQAMEGPGLGRREREAGLLIPLVFVKAVRGGESLPVWGFPVHQKGSMALGAPGCGGSSDSPASSMPAT